MNATLRRLSTVVMAMFLVLMISTTWIQFVQSESLNEDERNVRGIYSARARDRGPIVVGGDPIVTSVPVDDNYKYQRTYSDGDAGAASVYAPLTGYFGINGSVTGMERYANSYLAGEDDSLWLDRLQNLITGEEAQGSSVELTIDPEVQRAAWQALGDYVGAAVAIDPQTGAILAMVSKPSYDPNPLASHDGVAAQEAFDVLANTKPEINNSDGSKTQSVDPVLRNRAIETIKPPGSTFKLITAAAAIESGEYSAGTQIPARDNYVPPHMSRPIGNFGGYPCDPSEEMTLTNALKDSCNSAFAELAVTLGAEQMNDTFEAFGLNRELSIPMRVEPGSYPADSSEDIIAQSGIGQGGVLLTPLQDAMIAAGIANDGVVMEPYLIDGVRDSDLELVEKTEPRRLSNAVSSTTAAALTDMMVEVVENGSGTAAQIPGVRVAGKTGTAEEDPRAPTLWFTSFAPADDPQVAVAVMLENQGQATETTTGGALAAPIAAQIMRAAITQ